MTYLDFLSQGREVNSNGESNFEQCPSCGDSKWHFYFNADKEVGHCKKCGYSPNRRRLVRDLDLEDETPSLIETLVDRLDAFDRVLAVSGLDDSDDPDCVDIPIPLPDKMVPAWRSSDAMSYLRKRRVSLADVHLYEMSFVSKGRLHDRIVLPIRDITGSVKGYVARTIKPDVNPKYRYPAGLQVSHFLYGEDLIRKGCEEVVVVEGPFDRIRVGKDCVASFGKNLSEAQVDKLMSFEPKSVVLMWDPDAKKEAENTGITLSHYFPTRIVHLPEGSDPGSLDPRTIRSLIRRTPVFESIKYYLGGVQP